VLQAFGIADIKTAEYISKILGQRTEIWETESHSLTTNSQNIFDRERSRSTSHQQNRTQRAVYTADELMRVPGVFVIQRGDRPLHLFKILYYRDAEYDGLHDPNPYV